MKRIILSHYTLAPDRKGAVVGKLKAVGSEHHKVSFRLGQEAQDRFEIKNDVLKLKENRLWSGAEISFYHDISITAAGGDCILTEEFRIVRDDFLENGVVAHRGAHKHGLGSPNSMTAFKDAVNKGCAAFECDVLLSKDKKVVVVHGPGSGCDGGEPDLPIHTSTYEQLSRVNLGNGDTIPLLEDVLLLVMKQNRTGIVIEVKETKDGNDLQLAGSVFDIVKNLKAAAWVQYISFNYEQLLEILEKDEFARCSPIEHCHKDVARYAADGMWGVDFRKDKYKKKMIRELKQEDLKLNAWTVNEPRLMKKFKAWGFDFLTTDEPEECLKVE